VQVEERSGLRILRTGNHLYEGGDRGTFAQRRQGHLPMLLHPSPHRVLVLGVGTGSTVGAVAMHPGVRIEAVELLAEVLETLPYFAESNSHAGANAAVRFHQADARSYVRAEVQNRHQYDVVIADLFHPQQAGVGNLYTREHFAAIRALLEPGGLFMQWVPLY